MFVVDLLFVWILKYQVIAFLILGVSALLLRLIWQPVERVSLIKITLASLVIALFVCFRELATQNRARITSSQNQGCDSVQYVAKIFQRPTGFSRPYSKPLCQGPINHSSCRPACQTNEHANGER